MGFKFSKGGVGLKLLHAALPVAAGLAAAAAVLAVNPRAGQKIGDWLYSMVSVRISSYAYAVGRAAPSVVNIYVTALNTNYTSPEGGTDGNPAEIKTSASGVIMSKDGYIVTNYHVVPSSNEPGQSIWAMSRDGQLYQAFVIGYDRRTDIAVLKVDAKNLPPIECATDEPMVGDIVLAIGNPNNLGQTVTHGIISATARSGSGLIAPNQMNIREGIQDLIQTDAPINSGNSGGALVNTAGEMIGINTASINSYQTYGIGFAVPSKLVVSVMREIIQHGRVIRGYLGISDNGSVPLPNRKGVGVRVAFIDPRGPAYGVLQPGDVIYEVNGSRISSLKELIETVSKSRPGAKLDFKVFRGDDSVNLSVILAEDRPGIDG